MFGNCLSKGKFQVRGAESVFSFKPSYVCDSDMFCTMNSCCKG